MPLKVCECECVCCAPLEGLASSPAGAHNSDRGREMVLFDVHDGMLK